MSQNDAMQVLADKQEITENLYRYCRSVDRLDIPLGHSIWHDDAVADYGPGFYQGPGKGVIDVICKQHLHLLHHTHQVANILIDVDGDTAGSEAYVTANLRSERDGQLMQMTVWGRYIDKWSRRNGRWGIDKRVLVMDFNEMRPAKEMNRSDNTKRDNTDPSYTVLKTR